MLLLAAHSHAGEPPRPAAPSAHTQLADPAFLEQFAATRGFSLGWPSSVSVSADGRSVLFLRSPPRGFVRDLYEFDASSGKTRLVLSAERLLGGADEKLSVEELARRERMRSTARGIAAYELSEDSSRVLVPLSGSLVVVDRAGGRVRTLPSAPGHPIDPRLSPDGRWVASVRNGDLYVQGIDAPDLHRLTETGSDTLTNGLAEFVAQEEMGRFHGYWWSPDSRSIAFQETDQSGVELLHISDPLHPERAPNSFRYPRAGQPNARVRLGVVPATGGTATWVQWDHQRFPYLATVKWQRGGPLTILVQNRRQTAQQLLAVDTSTGSTRHLLTETDDAWLNLDQATPHWLEDGTGFLWSTERRGGWQVELRAPDGSLLHELTGPQLGYRSLLDVDCRRGIAWLTAAADPLEAHLYEVPLDPAAGEPRRTTTMPGVHSAVFSKQHDVYVHTAFTRQGERTQTVVGPDGRGLGQLESVAERPPFEPNVELTTVGDEPPFHAALVRPRDFDPSRRYPVVVNVYGGPQAQTVTPVPAAYLMRQWVADHGFVVVSIDGRGTPARGRDWERVIQGNLIDVPLADQVAGLGALAARYPELDLSRVGIYGWSFGGYFAAMAAMRRPDVFHVAVAGAPVADWHDYDTHYTERYLGLPDQHPEAYERSSVLTYAKQLRRPLLLIHGTADDNVYFLHSLKISDALFRAGIEHDFLPLSGHTHMVADPAVTRLVNTRIADYLVEHLRPAEAR
ncbi:MAG: DPP IV N-terminal domain-containing protein [Pirellulales bacterium]